MMEHKLLISKTCNAWKVVTLSMITIFLVSTQMCQCIETDIDHVVSDYIGEVVETKIELLEDGDEIAGKNGNYPHSGAREKNPPMRTMYFQNHDLMDENSEKPEKSPDRTVKESMQPGWNLARAKLVAEKNLAFFYNPKFPNKGMTHNYTDKNATKYKDQADFIPGKDVPPFSLETLQGVLSYPGPVINRTTPVLFLGYNTHSGFLLCLFNCSGTDIGDLLEKSPADTHYVFLSQSENAKQDVIWMKHRFTQESNILVAQGR